MIAAESFYADEQYHQIWVLRSDSACSEAMGVGTERRQQREKKYPEALTETLLWHSFSISFTDL